MREKVQDHPTLGIIRLDYDYPTALGDVDNPYSFGYPVVYRVVPGLTFQMAQTGQLTAEVASEFEAAIRWLTEVKGVTAITGDCGFMMWFEEHARSLTRTPCSLSALMQLPAISATLSKTRDKILVVTANQQSLNPMSGLIHQVTGAREEHEHLVYIGLEDVPHFGHEVEHGLAVDVTKAEVGIVKKVQQALKSFPEARAILLECTELPPYAAAIRAATGLPVYDAITNCNFVMKAFMEDEHFSRRGFYQQWNGRQESYRFGKNLTSSQRGKLVSVQHHDDNDAEHDDDAYQVTAKNDNSEDLWGQSGTHYSESDYLHLDHPYAQHQSYGYMEVLGKHHELLRDAHGNLFHHHGHYAYEAYLQFLDNHRVDVIPTAEYKQKSHADAWSRSTIYVMDDYTHYFETWTEPKEGTASSSEFQYHVYFNPVSGTLYGTSEGTQGPDDVVVEEAGAAHSLHYVGRNTYEEQYYSHFNEGENGHHNNTPPAHSPLYHVNAARHFVQDDGSSNNNNKPHHVDMYNHHSSLYNDKSGEAAHPPADTSSATTTTKKTKGKKKGFSFHR